MPYKKPSTKDYIYHRLIKLESEIVLTVAAIERRRGGVPIELVEIKDTVKWAQHMMKSVMLRFWLGDTDDFGSGGEMYGWFMSDRELAQAENERLSKNPDKLQLLKDLKLEDERNGIVPRGI